MYYHAAACVDRYMSDGRSTIVIEQQISRLNLIDTDIRTIIDLISG